MDPRAPWIGAAPDVLGKRLAAAEAFTEVGRPALVHDGELRPGDLRDEDAVVLAHAVAEVLVDQLEDHLVRATVLLVEIRHAPARIDHDAEFEIRLVDDERGLRLAGVL